ncbi:metal ABC transporter permease [Corynebacterium alimapuense]|uniref:Zinc ABC transporter permease n=1 Tax=Corynebacterium alimapuense TaxID=1576874 RepID=A0A3M8K6P0_9CORY|nr:metal ABC transporter permease [Corynebacterium alimapuense]RNE48174.1 zinc ABC transporter permease [Corynebacterium alimapuense]
MTPVEFFADHTFTMVFWGTTIIGVVAGTLGSFAYLRRQSLISDVISHSALPGTLAAFLLMTSLGLYGRSMLALIIGAVIVGTFVVVATNWIPRATKIKIDTAMAVVLSAFFGLGMLMMQYIQNNPIPDKGGIQDYLFGNASTITKADLAVSLSIGGIALLVLLLMWKEFALTTFDREHAAVMGFNNRLIDAAMFVLIAIATVIGAKAIGLVLMVAFVVTPPAAARQWTSTLPGMVFFSGLIGGVGSAVGTYLSIAFGPIPTGPVIAVTLFVIFLFSLLAAPDRSIIVRAIRRRRAIAELKAAV